jgi:sulfite exporter TauE/SafE
MTSALLAALFFAGLLGGLHCAGMCGALFHAAAPAGPRRMRILLALHGGRLASYAALGTAVAAIGGGAVQNDGWRPLQIVLFGLANMILLGVALDLLGWRRLLSYIESAGGRLWRHLLPLLRPLLPPPTPAHAALLGLAWAAMPCGLVYAALALAMLAADAVSGAALMLAFGLGTLPNLIAVDLALARARRGGTPRIGRIAAGIALIGLAGYGLAHAADPYASVLCLAQR